MDKATLIAGVGHICFECHRVIEAGEVISGEWVGPLPVYHHTSCLFGEEKTEEIKRATQEGELYYE